MKLRTSSLLCSHSGDTLALLSRDVNYERVRSVLSLDDPADRDFVRLLLVQAFLSFGSLFHSKVRSDVMMIDGQLTIDD